MGMIYKGVSYEYDNRGKSEQELRQDIKRLQEMIRDKDMIIDDLTRELYRRRDRILQLSNTIHYLRQALKKDGHSREPYSYKRTLEAYEEYIENLREDLW